MSKLMNFKEKQNLPLFNMLSDVMSSYDFINLNIDKATPDLVTWDKDLSSTLRTTMFITLYPTLAPDHWSIVSKMFIYSSYAADLALQLGLDDCSLPTNDWPKQSAVPILGFSPSGIRWEENSNLKDLAIQGNNYTLAHIREELIDVYDHYAAPILEIFGTVSGAANFLLNSPSLYKTKRFPVSRPRYALPQFPVWTAVLLIENGEFKVAMNVLEKWKNNEGNDQTFLATEYGRRINYKVEKLILFLNGKLN
ncbi:hypothetical protein H8K32_13120 [Undibacterium jejuense]|uniref:Uncharacterized protein n=1 Tax=Undibacterium jejuense TaxID=1344949 RepID=A0A923HNZ0_9BURK|nr:hypothetical protein [Undibacterium jejuense]MBC3863046.1 hypothetical protein [Undibacterium jejuense]